jgi:hypothetical protein
VTHAAACIVACAALALAGNATAAPSESSHTGTTVSGSFRARFGVERAEALRGETAASERLRGLERLAAAGTERAVDRLVEAVLPGGTATTPEERLVAVRALAAFTANIDVRRALFDVLGGHATSSPSDAATPLDELARRTAALALARSGAADAIESLGKALGGADIAASAAENALVAYPPRALTAMLHGAREKTLALAKTLDALGDQRGFDALRALVIDGTNDVRAAAAVGLTHLGDFETVALAEHWRASHSPPELRVAAAQILALAHAKDAGDAIAELLADDATFAAGVDLALDAPSRAAVPELVKRLGHADVDAAKIVAALGRAGGADAAKILETALADPERAALAAHALARMSGSDAEAVLERALSRPPSRRLAARAGALRWLVQGERLDGLERSFDALARSTDVADRAAAEAGMCALDPRHISAALDSHDAEVVESVASLLLLAPDAIAVDAARRIANARAPSTATALALALAVPAAQNVVPTRTLVALIDGGGPATPLAALAFAARDEEDLRPTTLALLADGDPFIRAHTAFGLGDSAEPDATGILENAYRFELDPDVRAAVVRGLSRRREPTRSRTLRLAAELDPERTVREVARLALAGARLGPEVRGDAAAWLVVGSTEAGGHAARAAITLRTPSGIALPLVTDADGIAVAAGISRGPVELRVAPGHADDEDRPSGNEKTLDAGSRETR